ncbi:MAG: hypothetical protein U0J65_05325 [Christensenellales bacterium]|nr:hypothetical protein [Christensenellales bacterium]
MTRLDAWIKDAELRRKRKAQKSLMGIAFLKESGERRSAEENAKKLKKTSKKGLHFFEF